MIEIIAGEKGKGKTKELLAKVNHSVAAASGNIVYLDKSQKHMYELNNKVRLINVMDYPIDNCDEFLGFLCGIVSQDHDLEEMYLDSFLTIAFAETDDEIQHAIEKIAAGALDTTLFQEMSPNYLSVQKQRLSFPYNYFAVKRLLR